MGEAERVADPAVTDLLNPVPAQRARLLLAQGDLAAAARWTERARPGRRRRAELRPRAGVPGAGPGAARAGAARPGARAPRPAAAPRPWPRTGRAASSRSRRCGRWRWRRTATRPAPWPPWPRRSRSPTPRATSASSSTRAHRWPPCSAGSYGAQHGRACPATTSAGWCGRSRHDSDRPRLGRAADRGRRAGPGHPAQRARARGAAPAGRRQAEPGDRRRAAHGAQHGQEARHPHLRQARRHQPHRGDRPRPRARPAVLEWCRVSIGVSGFWRIG